MFLIKTKVEVYNVIFINHFSIKIKSKFILVKVVQFPNSNIKNAAILTR